MFRMQKFKRTKSSVFVLAALPLVICCAIAAPSQPLEKTNGIESRQQAPSRVAVPAWIFPVGSAAPEAPPTPIASTEELLRLPHSTQAFTRAALNNRFTAPDWYPQTHAPMPEVVARGREPDLYACGFCHTPSGHGRPENAPLAGLPSAYIVRQVMNFQSGARRPLSPGVFPPADVMIHEAMQTTAAEAESAARYFSREKLRSRVVVRESATVPVENVVGFVYTPIAGGGNEPLGTRLIELAQDPEQHENRDEQMQYIAYVPPGSIARGRRLTHFDDHRTKPACITCHGENLRGLGEIPPLAGRSPSYLLRQLLAFETGARSGSDAQAMQTVVADLTLENMIDAVAYAASLTP